MKAHTVHMTFNTEERRLWIRITEDVQAAVDEAGIGEGMALVSVRPCRVPGWLRRHRPVAARALHDVTKRPALLRA
jgi:hypothetical protein